MSGNGGIDEQALRDWASDPDAEHLAIAPSDDELEDLFRNLAREISHPGATEIVIDEKVTDCFQILSLSLPTKGAATLLDDRTIQWKIPELGATQSESAALVFRVQHLGACSGVLPVNASIEYTDAEGNDVDFGAPTIAVDCGGEVFPEPCPEPIDVYVDGCEDSVEIDAGAVVLSSLGRILQLDVTVRRVCPGKRVALAVILTEVDDADNEHQRGVKTLVVPAHTGDSCRDVTVRCVKFVLPEELDVSGDADAMCDRRNFRVRLIAHYIDSGFGCCGVL